MIITKTVTAEDLRKVGREIMEFHCDLKSAESKVEKDERIIIGWASTGAVDRVGDVLEPSAFRKALKAYEKNNPVLLAHHDPELAIGSVMKAEIVPDKGVRITAKIAKGTDPTDTPERIWNLIDQGVLRAFSVGFRILRREDILENGMVTGWRILDLDWYENSVVAIPANPETLFSVGKSISRGTDLDYDLYERSLWGIPPYINAKNERDRQLAGRINQLADGIASRLAESRNGG